MNAAAGSNGQAVDLLVLGGGMAGLTAAAWTVRRGGSVVLVERGELGGSALHAGFLWTAPSVDELRAQIPDGDPELARRLIEGFEPGLDWVRSLDVEVQPAVEVLRFGRGHQTSILNYLNACERSVREQVGSEIILGATAQRLLFDGERVAGAAIELPAGAIREVQARATLLATGGFQGDADLRRTLIHPNAQALQVRGNPYSQGEGLRLAREAGARIGPDDAGFYGHLMPSGIAFGEREDFPAITLYYSEHAVLLNLEARRFVDETVGDHLTAIALVEQPEARGLLIHDERVRREWILRPYVEGIRPTDTFDVCYRRGARAAVAEELDELAYLPPEWGYDGEAVRTAVLDFNARCREGSIVPARAFDSKPLEQPPFYVIETVPAITFTFGGVAIDADARALDTDGRPIPGLFAAGADAGGLYVRAYAGGLAAALVFGLTAAQAAFGTRVASSAMTPTGGGTGRG